MTPALEGEFRRQYEAAIEAEAAVSLKMNKLQTSMFIIHQMVMEKRYRYPFRGMLYRLTGWSWLISPDSVKRMRNLRCEAVAARKRVVYYQDRAEVELVRRDVEIVA
jgi:hypothetical protein